VDEVGRACSTNMCEDECIWDIGGRARRKKRLERPRNKCVDNTKMVLREIVCSGMDRDQ
jgi:hypothetical protein